MGNLLIPSQLLDDVDLMNKPKSIILMGYIVTELNTYGKFNRTNKELAEWLDVTVKSVKDYLSLLERKGYIKRSIVKNAKGEVIERTIAVTKKALPTGLLLTK